MEILGRVSQLPEQISNGMRGMDKLPEKGLSLPQNFLEGWLTAEIFKNYGEAGALQVQSLIKIYAKLSLAPILAISFSPLF